MNQSDNNNDKLREFLISAESEQTSADFTGKMMELISKEPLPIVKKRFRFLTVPVIYCTLLAVLTIASLFIPNYGTGIIDGFPWVQLPDNLFQRIPRIEFDIFSNIRIPETMKYVMVGCMGFFIFDLILFRYFQPHSNSN